MPLKRSVHSGVTGLAESVNKAQGEAQSYMDQWARSMGLASADWLDTAGGRFTGVGQAWNQVCGSFKDMGLQVGSCTMQAAEENAQTVQMCAGYFT